MASYNNQAVIKTGNIRVAHKRSDALALGELKHRLKALDEWQGAIERAGLSKLTSGQIDKAIAKELKRRKKDPLRKGMNK